MNLMYFASYSSFLLLQLIIIQKLEQHLIMTNIVVKINKELKNNNCDMQYPVF